MRTAQTSGGISDTQKCSGTRTTMLYIVCDVLINVYRIQELFQVLGWNFVHTVEKKKRKSYVSFVGAIPGCLRASTNAKWNQ